LYNEPFQQNRLEKAKLLHSRYNPQAEADRYISSLSLGENILFFILIEPGLGYITASLKTKFPKAKVIALHIEQPINEMTVKNPDSQWYLETGTSVQDFLETEIPDTKAEEIRLIEWRPALSVYGQAYLALLKETVEFIKRVDASARTYSTFGQRWFRNFFKNLDISKSFICPTPHSRPVLVTGAGPGLEDTIPFIKEKRDEFFILASSSSAAALINEDITPNLVISIDGTTWAKVHLYELFRLKNASPPPLAAALTAALPSQYENFPLMLISDGSFWQTLILNELKIPFIALPQRGTVSASALDMAFVISEGEIFFTGFDLANRDIRSHARPYCLDRFMEEGAGRINPFYSQVYKRSSLLKEGGSYGIYASWFKKQLSNYPKRLHSLGENNQVFSSIETSIETSIKCGSGNSSRTLRDEKASVSFETFTKKGNYSQKAYIILEKALKKSNHSEILQKELIPMLFKGDERKSKPKIDELIDILAGFRRGEKNG